MACTCGCGNSYDFRPIGHWICHRCHAINDAGPYGSQRRSSVMDPDEVDRMVVEGIEFAEHADASVRAHPDSWQAWYSLGATYAARGNLMEAGLVWTKAGTLVGTDDVLEKLVERCSERMSGCLSTVVKSGGKTNQPYMYGLEHMALSRLGGRVSFCRRTYDGVCREITGMPPREAFGLRNMASLILLQRTMVLPDIREHVPLLRTVVEDADAFREASKKGSNPIKRMISRKSSEYTDHLSEPYRLALDEVERAISGVGSEELDRLASLQRDDGTAAFVGRLSAAVKAGAEVAYLRATKAGQSEISEKESEMRADIDAYVSMYMSGDASVVNDPPIYIG